MFYLIFFSQFFFSIYLFTIFIFISCVRKSIHPRKLVITLPYTDRPSVRPHHREINAQSPFCGLPPLRGSTPQCYRVEWVSVTKEPEPTNPTDFDAIFADLSPFFRNIVGCSTFVEDSFEWPRMLLGISTWSQEKFSIRTKFASIFWKSNIQEAYLPKTTGGNFACACVHPLNDNSVGAFLWFDFQTRGFT